MIKKILTLVILIFVGVSSFAQKIDSELQHEMSQRADNEKINVFVIMTPQYDRSTLTRGASFYSDRKDRQTYVVNELKSFAETTQSDIRKSLDAMEKNDQTTTPNVLWIANALSFSATKSAIEELAKRKDVSIIGFDKEEYMLFDEDSKPADNTREMTPNITQVRANEVWNLGYTGEGVIVAVVDSGVNYNHLDLADHLWDGGTEFPYHGWDFVNNDNDPMDDNGHGTHCAGTVCGDGTAGSQTGMAPDASLMIVKCLNAAGRGSHSNCVSAMQWAVEHGCDIISMSLGAAVSDVATRTFYRNTCVAVLDAGIVAAIAAGNDGDDLATYPIPYNVGVPGGCPPPYIDPRQAVNTGGLSCSVCIGAVDYNDVPAYFTSHGPVTWADTEYGDYPYSLISGVDFGLIRPDVCAPGVSVKSANYLSTSGYSYKSGTSMATPCVAGCMALILSKDHNVTPAEMCKLLEETAIPLSESKSNLTGCGRVDVMAAISNMASGTLKLDSFTINDSQGNNDNMLNPGETVTLNLSLNNDSDYAIDNASLELATESDYISISNNVKVLPHFNAHQTLAVDNAFSFSLAEGVIPGNVIAFTTAVKINDETVGLIPFSITVYDYLLHYKEISFLNDSNGNGSLEPGETADIRVFVENGGNVQANSLVGTLTTDYEYLTINESVKSYGNMASGDLRYADYSVSLSNSAPQNYSFDLLLTMVDNHNRQTQFAFDHEKYAINATINIEGGGTITGAGFYDRGATCVLTATPNTGYLFENWSKNNVLEHTTMSYSFEATANADYVANLIPINGVYLGSGEDHSSLLPGSSSALNQYSLSQQIYTAAEISHAGYIRSVAFYNDGYYQRSNYDVYLKHTSKNTFQSNQDWETVSESDKLFSGVFDFSVGVWTVIEFDKLFEYDGISNLVIVVDDNTGYKNPVFGRVYSGNGDQSLYMLGYSTNLDPLNVTDLKGNTYSLKNQIILEIIDANTTYTVSAEPNIIAGGTVTGGGTYYINTSCTLTATPNEGYEFLNWTKDGVVVSTESSYTINVLNDCSIVANFYSNDPISFADDKVKELCVNNWDTNDDGEVSYLEAAMVTSIGSVFSWKSNITSFNELQYFTGVTEIQGSAFAGCNNLTSIALPCYINSIKSYAFQECRSLESLEIPAYLSSIGDGAFINCYSLEQIAVSENNEVYDSRDNCNAIIKTSANQLIVGCNNTIIPNTVQSIGEYAFYGLGSLESINIPASVTLINEYAFGHNYLKQITVHPDNPVYDSRNSCNAIIKTDDEKLVAGCRNTIIPNTITKIGSRAFYQCDSLTSIEIPSSVNSIEYYAFYDCRYLSSISLRATTPPSLSNEYVFYYVNRDIPFTVYCESVDLYATTPIWNTFTNFRTFDPCEREITASAYPVEGGYVSGYGNYLVGDSCTLVATPNDGYLFLNWSRNGEVVSVNSNYSFVVNLGVEYVANFMELNGLYIGEGETVNQYLPSYYNYSLSQQIYTADEIGAGTIRGMAFYNAGAEDIRDFTIFIKNTEKQAFNTTYSWYNGSKDWIPVTESDMVFSGDVIMSKGNWNFITFDASFVSDGLSNIVIVVDDNSNSFSYSDYMLGRVFDTDERQALYVASYSPNYDPYDPSSYNGYALNVKNQIIFDIEHPDTYNVVVSKDIDEAGTVSGAGTYDYGTTCTLSVTANEGYTFRYWIENGKMLSANNEVTLYVNRPYDITAIFSEDAPIPFADNNVKSICISSWDSRGDGELSYAEAAAVTDLGSVFQNNTAIQSFDELRFFTGLNTIGNQAFYYCTHLKSIVLPNTITSVEDWAFFACNNLKSINIPSSVVSMGKYAFGYCTGLTSMTVDATTPPSISSNTFMNVDKSIPVYIPYGTLIAYQTAPYWSEFTNFHESSDAIITFSDPVVKSLCVDNWDTNNDGELSYAEAAAVTDLGEVFKSNQTITSFNELQYFTGLTSIGDYAFYYCYNLSAIEIPNSVTSIGDYAFWYCIGLTAVEIPNSVTSIENWAFSSCTGLTNIEIPNSVTSIGWAAFVSCVGLNQMVVETGNTIYDSRGNCNTIIETATNILISGCKTTVIPNSVTSIGFGAFYGCTGLTAIEIPDSVISIGGDAFYDCTGLTAIEIPNTVTSIGGGAFYGCTGLTAIEIPNSVTSISYNPLGHCNSLTQIVVNESNTVYDSRDNCNAIVATATNKLISGCKTTIIPNSVTLIGYSAFYGCTGLTAIEIPNSVTSIDGFAFYSCCDLTTITVKTSTPPVLGTNVFNNVDKSIPVYIPYGTLTAYQTAPYWNEFTNFHESSDPIISFADPNVKSLCVANWDTNNDGELSYEEAAAVTDLGEVFRGNHDITSFDELQYFTGLTEIADNAFRYSISLSSITLPNTITTIGSYSFYQCDNLQSIEIPGSVTMIEDEVFGLTPNLSHITVDPNNTVYDSRNDCNAIINSTTNALLVGCYNTTIPNTVAAIERYAFRGCDKLTSIEIPNSVTTIESETFYGCHSLTSITIPSSVTEIGSHVFANCDIAQIVVEQGNAHYDSRDNCNAIIDSETNALIVGCKNTVVPNTVTKIASSAFYSCDGLTSIVIPKSCSNIAECGLYCCVNLEMITFNCFTPPTLGTNAIAGIDRSIPLYVPCGTEAAYAAAVGWNEFTNILCHEVVQEFNLSAGWNWWSTYIEQNSVNGLEMLEESLGSNGVVIKSQNEFAYNDFVNSGIDEWFNNDMQIDNENCYLVYVSNDCNVQLSGQIVDPADHPITINNKWSWISYLNTDIQSVATALDGFEASQNDIIKNCDDVGIFYNGVWLPEMNLIPGSGYMYFSNSDEVKYLIYNNTSNRQVVEMNEDKFWNYNAHLYENTMTLISVININDEELADGNFELAAYVDNECRGSVQLKYFKPLNRYFAVMNIFGNNGDIISFKLADVDDGTIYNNSVQTVVFENNNIVGILDNPYIIRFDSDKYDMIIDAYPNPVDKNTSFSLNVPNGERISELVIVNCLGVEVIHESDFVGSTIKGISVGGVYNIYLTTDKGGVYRGRLVVK